MTRFKPTLLLAASALLATVTLDASRPHYGGILRIETSDAAVMRRLNTLAYETLVALDAGGRLRPALATSWQAGAGGRRWTFRLRRGVTLHDGSTLQPSQVAASLQQAHADWLVTTDADAIAIEPGGEAPELPVQLADAQNAIAVQPATGALIGSGPFRIERVEAGLITLHAHDRYWDSRPFVDAIEVRTGRSPADQLIDVETGRADMVSIEATDARRMEQRQLRIDRSRPLELVALVFEPQLATAANDAIRRTLAAAIDRDAIARVVMQGYAEAATMLLPSSVNGREASGFAKTGEPLPRSAVAALPANRRSLALRVPATDAVAQALAQRVAVNARDAGFIVTVQAPPGLGPRFDMRVLRVRFRSDTPATALTDIIGGLGPRTIALAGRITPPDAGSSLETVQLAERALLARDVIVPIVHIPELYAFSTRSQSWNGPAVLPSGAWNLADVWLSAP